MKNLVKKFDPPRSVDKDAVATVFVSSDQMPRSPEGEKMEVVMTEASIKNRLTDDEYSELLKTRAGRVALNATVGHFDKSKISTKYYNPERDDTAIN